MLQCSRIRDMLVRDPDADPRIRTIHLTIKKQCCSVAGSGTCWYGSGCRSSDPYLGLTDPPTTSPASEYLLLCPQGEGKQHSCGWEDGGTRFRRLYRKPGTQYLFFVFLTNIVESGTAISRNSHTGIRTWEAGLYQCCGSGSESGYVGSACEFLSLKNDVDVPSKNNKQKNFF